MPDEPMPQTKELLLDAAREEFAAHGIAGARVAHIADRAGVNRERVYGYFGSKEGLFDAVVTEALDQLADAVPLSADDDPAEYVGRVYDFHRRHPKLLRLLLWEALHYRTEPLPDDDERAGRYAEKVSTLATALDGTGADEDAAATLLTLIGLAAWPTAMPQLTRLILNHGPDAAAADDAMRTHLVEFARNALG